MALESMALEYVILRLLRDTPLHGYALRQLAMGLRFFYPISNPNLYPVLRRIESEGWVTHQETVVDNRLRKVYEITDEGRAALTAWLCEAPEAILELADPLALKVSLLTEETAPIAAGWLDTEADNVRAQLAEGEQRMLEFADVMSRYTRHSSEFALEVGRIRLQWLEDLANVLREEREQSDQGPPDD